MTDWFPITPHHPPPLAQVRGVITYARQAANSYDVELLISRGRPPHSNVWASWERGRATPLSTSATPCLWQPQYPDRWKAELPLPVPRVTPQMWSRNMAYPGNQERVAAESDHPETFWWRDASRIRYQAMGEVSLRMAEGRVMRAVATCERGADLSVRTRTFSSLLADMMAAQECDAYPISDYVPRMRALPADISDFDTAMAWFVALNPAQIPDHTSQAQWDVFNRVQQVLIWRAMGQPLSYGVIGNEWSVTKQAAMDTYARSIKAIHRVANGLPAFPSVSPPDQIAALRERNRMARAG